MGFPQLPGKFVLAPMSGVSDVAFRVLCKRHGAAMTYTEFCSAEGIVRGNEATFKQLEIADEESPVGVQLFGSNVESVRAAAKLVEDKASVIDFNLGCPAWHVLSQGCGSALLAHPDKIEELVREVASALNTPFTVKLRMGLNNNSINYLEVASRCVSAGAVAVALHARTTKQGYSGQANWDAIEKLANHIDVPVIGNGDVTTPEDAVRMLETGCDYVMIGRAARNNPFIFSQANELLATGSYTSESEEEKLSLFFEYCDLAKQYDIDVNRLRGHAMSLSRGIRGAKELRQSISRCSSSAQIVSEVRSFAARL